MLCRTESCLSFHWHHILQSYQQYDMKHVHSNVMPTYCMYSRDWMEVDLALYFCIVYCLVYQCSSGTCRFVIFLCCFGFIEPLSLRNASRQIFFKTSAAPFKCHTENIVGKIESLFQKRDKTFDILAFQMSSSLLHSHGSLHHKSELQIPPNICN